MWSELKQRYLGVLEDVHDSIKNNRKFAMRTIIKYHGVSSQLPAAMIDLGIITQYGRATGATYEWTADGPPDMEMVDALRDRSYRLHKNRHFGNPENIWKSRAPKKDLV
ncbi:hypothetical protein PP178_04040 [Zeaxanthinibacter sp. PT1]|uniref:hypothetical protein n=1 Tax=Zeaxanthinibacter TaxID=561554 RepID=UPI00234925C0|nr:hypothetical protein [Zeaxanthinibacter sp. PT1]MDC6350711.1 hypothetical protein [Zeaxanthinibacter sp. PT1]